MGFFSPLQNLGHGLSDAWDKFTGSAQVDQTNSANAAMAQKQMDFQEKMSNTAYQRGTKDMEAAGLNPMLAYSQGGASAPAGASAVMQPKPSGLEMLSKSLSSASAVSQIQNMAAQTELTTAQAAKTRAEIPGSESSSASAKGNLEKLQYELQDLREQYGDLLDVDEDGKKVQLRGWQVRARERLKGDIGENSQRARKAELENKIRDIESRLKGYDLPEAKAGSDFWEMAGKTGTGLKTFGGMLGKFLGGAGSLLRRH